MTNKPTRFDQFWWWVIAAFALVIAAWGTLITIATKHPNLPIEMDDTPIPTATDR